MSLSTRSSPAMEAANVNGWNGSIKYNLSSRIGLLADFGGQYGKRGMRPLSIVTGGVISDRPGAPWFSGNSAAQTEFQIVPEPANIHQHTLLFGPEIRVHRGARLTVNVHGLAGMALTSRSVFPLREPYRQPPDLLGNVPPPLTELSYGGKRWFAASVGGSVDYRITDRLSYRIIQPDLAVTFTNQFDSVRAYGNVRLSTGLVFNFGRR
ncbi:MAG: hypothetical protein IT168_23295 [Bryobacterales bacterium]|nr:hypothetical protein [Bryobacterales bacterium]